MTDTTPDYARLIERLEKVEPDTPGEGVTRYYRNPDGPGAAAALRTLLSRAEAAEARVTELEDLCNSLEAQAMGLAYDLKQAEAKLAGAMKVIEPFADVAEWDIGNSESDDDIFRPMDGRNSVAGLIRVGHLRAARNFLKENGNGE